MEGANCGARVAAEEVDGSELTTSVGRASLKGRGAGSMARTRRASARNSWADWYLWAESRRVEVTTNASTSTGMPGRSDDGGGTSLLTCWYAMLKGLSPSCGT